MTLDFCYYIEKYLSTNWLNYINHNFELYYVEFSNDTNDIWF